MRYTLTLSLSGCAVDETMRMGIDERPQTEWSAVRRDVSPTAMLNTPKPTSTRLRTLRS